MAPDSASSSPAALPHAKGLKRDAPEGEGKDDAASPASSIRSGVGGAGPSGSAGAHQLLAGDGSKKRRTGPGSRGVANLTPEQLAKKRANDREAQRAIRERTKAQIENLERQIRELTLQQPYQELQAVLREKEAVEAENAEIKRRLASIMAMIQPLLGGLPFEQPNYPSPSHTTIVPIQNLHPSAPPSTTNASTPPSAASPASIPPPGSWQGDLSPGGPPVALHPGPPNQSKMLHRQQHELLHGLDLGGERLVLDFLLDPNVAQRVERIQNGVNGAQDSPQYSHIPMKHDLAPSMSSTGSHAFGQEYAPLRLEYAHDQGMAPTSDGPIPEYAAPIINCAPTCPLDNLLIDFLGERRQRAAEGLPTHEIIGPKYPSVSSLLNPSSSRYSHPLSKVFTDILRTFPDISALPERVAVLYAMFLLMRWRIDPTPENYTRMPDWCAPTKIQLQKPHAAWIDNIPFPQMREKLIRDYAPDDFPLDDFFVPFTTTLSLNWPYEEIDTLLKSPDSNELMINPVFERHLRRLENWTLGDAFAKAFPALAGTYNHKSRQN